MAITGKFIADFASFYDAVQKAETSLRSFETGAGKVENSLNKMVDSFSGRKIISDASLMAEAVERIGGTSKLTEAELARVSSTAAEAAAKMRAMGIDVPPGIQRIADQTKNVDTAQTSLIGTLKSVAAAMGIAFSVQQITALVGRVIDFGGEMTDLAARTGISTDALQVFKFAGEQVGVSLDTIVGAITQMQNRLAGGDKSAIAALKDLGIGFEEIRRLSPDEQMTLIASKIALIPDPAQRTATAMDLMGKSASEVMPLLLSNFGEMAQKARDLGVVMSEKTIAAMDDLGDTMTAMKAVGIGLIADVMKPFVPLMGDMATAAAGFGPILRSSLTNAQSAFEQLLSMAAGAAKSINDWHISALESINVFGMQDEKIRALKEDSERFAAINKDLATTQSTVATTTTTVTHAVTESSTAMKEAADAAKKLDDAYNKMISDARNAEAMAQFNNAAEALARQAKNAEQLWLMERDAFQLSVAEKEKAAAAAAAQEADFARIAKESFLIIGENADAHRAAGEAAVSSTTAAIGGYAALTQQVEMSSDAIRAWIDLQRFTNQANAVLQQNPFFTSATQLQQIGNLPRRALGGSVTGGQAYVVGERGPELFVPSRGGAILANGMGSVVNNFYINGTAEDVARKVSDVLMRDLKLGRKLPAT